MTNFTFQNKNAGRTVRMLKTAFEAAEKGKAVYVLCGNNSDISRLRRLAVDQGYLNSSMKFESFTSLGEENIDWKNKRILGANENCELFIDHLAIEIKFQHILDLYHKYDV